MLSALVCVAALAACGSGTSGSEGGSSEGGASAADSFLQAWPQAESAVEEIAADAVLVAAGSGGLALADVPDSWTFTFFSPGTQHPYMVTVEHGQAGDLRDFGEAKADLGVTTVVDIESIKVGAADAVKAAREFGEAAGSVPMNVMVSGSFATTDGETAAAQGPGVWRVTFASGTDLADAVKFDVDMMTGEVAAVAE